MTQDPSRTDRPARRYLRYWPALVPIAWAAAALGLMRPDALTWRDDVTPEVAYLVELGGQVPERLLLAGQQFGPAKLGPAGSVGCFGDQVVEGAVGTQDLGQRGGEGGPQLVWRLVDGG